MPPDMPLGLLGELGKYGLLGVILTICIWVGWMLHKQLNACWDGRLSDQKVLSEALRANSVAMGEIVISNDARTRSSEAIARAVELSAASQTSLTLEVGNVRVSNNELRASNNELRAEVQRLRDLIIERDRRA
jgi:hypothetical protein